MAHSGELWVRARRRRDSRRVVHRHVHVCDRVVARLPRGTRSAVVKGTVRGHREQRVLRGF
jgi:hypothetical protein